MLEGARGVGNRSALTKEEVMIRALLLATVVCILALMTVTFVGHAIDAEIQQRVTFTRDGNVYDCARVVESDGRVQYQDCDRLP